MVVRHHVALTRSRFETSYTHSLLKVITHLALIWSSYDKNIKYVTLKTHLFQSLSLKDWSMPLLAPMLTRASRAARADRSSHESRDVTTGPLGEQQPDKLTHDDNRP